MQENNGQLGFSIFILYTSVTKKTLFPQLLPYKLHKTAKTKPNTSRKLSASEADKGRVYK